MKRTNKRQQKLKTSLFAFSRKEFNCNWKVMLMGRVEIIFTKSYRDHRWSLTTFNLLERAASEREKEEKTISRRG